MPLGKDELYPQNFFIFKYKKAIRYQDKRKSKRKTSHHFCRMDDAFHEVLWGEGGGEIHSITPLSTMRSKLLALQSSPTPD